MSDADLRAKIASDLGMSGDALANRTTPELLVQHQRHILHKTGLGLGGINRGLEDSVSDLAVNVKDYGAVGDGVANDTVAIQNAINTLSNGGVLFIPVGTYLVTSTITVNFDQITIKGAGRNSVIRNSNNSTIFNVTSSGFILEDCQIEVTDTSRTNFSVTLTNANYPIINRVWFDGVDGSYRSGISFISGSMGTVSNCIFNHSCIKVVTWDVKIDKCWIWSMSCQYGIGVYSGCGNLTVTNTDIVPPLTSNASGLAGIHVDDTSKSFNLKFDNIYLDGNPTLVVRKGIYIGDGSGGVIISNVTANKMDSDCIHINSAFNVLVKGYSGYSNNNSGTGSREIYVSQTGVQSTEQVELSNIHCFLTDAIVGTSGPAIKIDLANAWQVKLRGFNIKHPAAGGGYVVPAVQVADITNMLLDGFETTATYSASGSIALAGGDTSKTITLSSPYPLAYRPKPSDIRFQFEGTPSQHLRIQFTNDNQIYVPFSAAIAGAGTLYWRVDFKR